MNRLHPPLFLRLSVLFVAIVTARIEADPTELPYKSRLKNLAVTVGPSSVTLDQDTSTFGLSNVEIGEMATGALSTLGGSIAEYSEIIDFTVDGAEQRLNDFSGPGLMLGKHALNAELDVLLTGKSGNGTTLDIRTENVVPGLSMGNFLTGINANPARAGGIRIGFLLKYLPEVSMGLVALFGLGSLLLALRRRFHALPPVRTIHLGQL